MPRYQPNGLAVAYRQLDFSAHMREAARRILATASDLTIPERQLLYDVMRRDGRSYFATLAAMLALSGRCECPSVRFHIVEVCRGQVLTTSQAAPIDVMSAFDAETDCQATADKAQLQHADRRALGTNAHAIEALTGHQEAIRIAIDSLHWERARLTTATR